MHAPTSFPLLATTLLGVSSATNVALNTRDLGAIGSAYDANSEWIMDIAGYGKCVQYLDWQSRYIVSVTTNTTTLCRFFNGVQCDGDHNAEVSEPGSWWIAVEGGGFPNNGGYASRIYACSIHETISAFGSPW